MEKLSALLPAPCLFPRKDWAVRPHFLVLQLPHWGNPPHFNGCVQNHSLSPKQGFDPPSAMISAMGCNYRGDKRELQVCPSGASHSVSLSGQGSSPVPYVADFNHDTVSSCVLIMQLKRGSMTALCLCMELSFFLCMYPLAESPPVPAPPLAACPHPSKITFPCFSHVFRPENPSQIH